MDDGRPACSVVSHRHMRPSTPEADGGTDSGQARPGARSGLRKASSSCVASGDIPLSSREPCSFVPDLGPWARPLGGRSRSWVHMGRIETTGRKTGKWGRGGRVASGRGPVALRYRLAGGTRNETERHPMGPLSDPSSGPAKVDVLSAAGTEPERRADISRGGTRSPRRTCVGHLSDRT